MKPLVVLFSLIALGFMYLAYAKKDWMWMIGAVILIYFNNRLLKKR